MLGYSSLLPPRRAHDAVVECSQSGARYEEGHEPEEAGEDGGRQRHGHRVRGEDLGGGEHCVVEWHSANLSKYSYKIVVHSVN
jgi:hypothetical protein